MVMVRVRVTVGLVVSESFLAHCRQGRDRLQVTGRRYRTLW